MGSRKPKLRTQVCKRAQQSYVLEGFVLVIQEKKPNYWKKQFNFLRLQGACTHTCTYIDVYVYIHTNTHIFLYIYRYINIKITTDLNSGLAPTEVFWLPVASDRDSPATSG